LSKSNVFLITETSDILLAEKQGNKVKTVNNTEGQSKSEPTWVEELFQGTFTNETRCLNCETVSKPVLLIGIYIVVFVTV
jgi:ubiquitin carboxyl-terminal hydrolase 12/46